LFVAAILEKEKIMQNTLLTYILILLLGYSIGATVIGGKNNNSNVIVSPTDALEDQIRNNGSAKVFVVALFFVILAIIILSSPST
jgi:hypothetical protein